MNIPGFCRARLIILGLLVLAGSGALAAQQPPETRLEARNYLSQSLRNSGAAFGAAGFEVELGADGQLSEETVNSALAALTIADALIISVHTDAGCTSRRSATCDLVDQLRTRLVLVRSHWQIHNGGPEVTTSTPRSEAYLISEPGFAILLGQDGDHYSDGVEQFALCGFIIGEARPCRESDFEQAGEIIACDSGCRERYQAVLRLAPAISMIRFTAIALPEPGFVEAVERQRLRVARWDAYLYGDDSSATQWPWELMLNGWLHDDGNREPPNGAISLIRPSAGLSVYDESGDEVSLAGLVELIGYRRWGYESDGSRGPEWGASLVAAYSPDGDGDDWGYGIMISTRWDIDVSVIRRENGFGDEEYSVLLSKDLTDFFGARDRSGLCRLIGGCGN